MNAINTRCASAYQCLLAGMQSMSCGLGPTAGGCMLRRAAECGTELCILQEGDGEQVLLTHELMGVLMLSSSSWL